MENSLFLTEGGGGETAFYFMTEIQVSFMTIDNVI